MKNAIQNIIKYFPPTIRCLAEVLNDAIHFMTILLVVYALPFLIVVFYMDGTLNGGWLLLLVPWFIMLALLLEKAYSNLPCDPYLKQDASYYRLVQEYFTHKSLVVAFDYDNTVFDFHGKGESYSKVIDLLRELKEIGCYLICFTANENIDSIRQYLTEKNIPFDAINENPPFFTGKSGKIYYNVLLDDRAGLIQVYEDLNRLIKGIKKARSGKYN